VPTAERVPRLLSRPQIVRSLTRVKPVSHEQRGGFAALTIGALGIVYGDIGTSPLYAMDQLFFGRIGAAPTPEAVLGGVSLVIWTITATIKYGTFR
jgi:KUP system potassium uptake protein